MSKFNPNAGFWGAIVPDNEEYKILNKVNIYSSTDRGLESIICLAKAIVDLQERIKKLEEKL